MDASFHGIDSDRTVILVEDDDAVRESLEILFETNGFPVRAFDSVGGFLAAGLAEGCVLLDLHLGSDSTADLLVHLERREWPQPTVILSGGADARTRDRAVAAGARAVFDKPADPTALVDIVRSILAPAR